MWRKGENMEIYKNLSLEDLPNEEWRDVVGWELSHEISNLGRVRTKSRTQKWGSYYREITPRILSQGVKANGYLSVHLSYDNETRNAYVHRLVAQAFIRPMSDGEEINHLDKVKKHNNVENLEICDRQRNYDYSREDILDVVAKPVYRYTLEGRFDKAYSSVTEAARDNNIGASSIVRACKGERNVANNHHFRYERYDYIHIPPKTYKRVLASSTDGIDLEFISPLAAAIYFNVKYNSIVSACTKHTKCKGHTFKYKQI